MRMAMSCLALPLAGRPTRRARRSSSSVDSGMSEKSSRLSGIGPALFARRLSRADDANRFFAILQPPQRVRNYQDSSSNGSSHTFRAPLELGVLGVVPIQSFRVAENGSGFFERHAVLLEVAQGFSGIPREHITVYTLIWPGWEAISLSRAQLVGGRIAGGETWAAWDGTFGKSDRLDGVDYKRSFLSSAKNPYAMNL